MRAEAQRRRRLGKRSRRLARRRRWRRKHGGRRPYVTKSSVSGRQMAALAVLLCAGAQ